MTSDDFNENDPTKTGTDWIWEAVHLTADEEATLAEEWSIPGKIAIKADIGHTHRPDRVIEESLDCLDAGACAVHLHILDEEGNDTGDIDNWNHVVGAITDEYPDALIDSGLRGDTFDEQMRHIEEGLFDVVPILPCWEPAYNASAIEVMHENGVTPEIVAWDTTDILLAKHFYIDRGILDSPTSWLLVPGAPFRGVPLPNPATMVQRVTEMTRMVREIDPEAFITMSASGRASSYLTGLGTLLGDHVRPGMGETHWRHPHTGEPIERNRTVIDDAISVARGLGRRPATPTEFKEMMEV